LGKFADAARRPGPTRGRWVCTIGVLNATQPEALIYEPMANGALAEGRGLELRVALPQEHIAPGLGG